MVFRALSPGARRWAVATAALLAVALATFAWHTSVDDSARRLSAELAELRRQLHAAQMQPVATAARPDFAAQLPQAASIDPVVRELQRASDAWGSAFVSVSSTPHEATLQTLGRTELAVTLRGSYPKLKSVLAEALDRFPELIVQRLTLRRASAPADLEARVDLVLVSRPLIAAANAGR